MYATLQDLIDRFGETEIIQLTDRASPPAGAIDSSVADRVLADSDATISDYLQGRYTLPLSVVPQSLERIACDLARYYLYDNHPTEAVQKKYDDAIAFLTSIAKGAIKLGVDVSDQPAPVAGTPQVSAPDRVFTQDTLKEF